MTTPIGRNREMEQIERLLQNQRPNQEKEVPRFLFRQKIVMPEVRSLECEGKRAVKGRRQQRYQWFDRPM